MVLERVRGLDRGGWTLLELMVVIAVIGIIATISIPVIFGYLQSATVRAGAQEMRAAFQLGKQEAITRRQNICVLPVAAPIVGYQFRQNTCGGPILALPGADLTGTFRLQNTVAVAGGGITFTPLGAAAPGGFVTVTGPNGNSLTVTVSAAGRITTP